MQRWLKNHLPWRLALAEEFASCADAGIAAHSAMAWSADLCEIVCDLH